MSNVSDLNDRKRARMATELQRLLSAGWTVAQLAALFEVSAGTIRSWHRGASMGTNAPRGRLTRLCAAEDARPEVLEIARSVRFNALRWDIRAIDADKAGAHLVAESYRKAAAYDRKRADILETIGL